MEFYLQLVDLTVTIAMTILAFMVAWTGARMIAKACADDYRYADDYPLSEQLENHRMEVYYHSTDEYFPYNREAELKSIIRSQPWF
jgi:hypothetical protein